MVLSAVPDMLVNTGPRPGIPLCARPLRPPFSAFSKRIQCSPTSSATICNAAIQTLKPGCTKSWSSTRKSRSISPKGATARQQVTVSVDEKPGIQALRNVAPDLPPEPARHPYWARDHEYKRLGTLSLLAALDLHTGQVTAQVHPRHRSVEFIALLKELDASYPQDHTIRLILDHHSAHISRETMSYLATRPNRFRYVHTPKHGSWLNLIETLFGKMARTFLKRIRVQSLQELKERILIGVAQINAARSPRWKKFDSRTHIQSSRAIPNGKRLTSRSPFVVF